MLTKRAWTVIGLGLAGAAAAAAVALQKPAIRPTEERVLRGYTGVYQWSQDRFAHLQLWNELTGTNQLTAFDESGEVRTLYPTADDRFFVGPGAAMPSAIESTVEFLRTTDGRITSMTWQKNGEVRRAERVEIERQEDVTFANDRVRLAGTLIAPTSGVRHPAVILVHASGAATREQILPLARFLVRHGIAVLAYDKRGAGGSTGDWNSASFADLAGDVVAAFEYLRTRGDIDSAQIGLLGLSQAGWVMPLAAVREPRLAFLISVSGPGVPGTETTIDQARNEMTASRMRPQMIEQVVELMKLQYSFVRTGDGWAEYAAAREKLAAEFGGTPPESFPGTPNDPWFSFIRRLLFYDPSPTLRAVRTPTLALFGQLDNNIVAEKNRAAWQAAFVAGGHDDFTLQVIPRANHIQLEATVGNNAEMPTLLRFSPAYFSTVLDWLAPRIKGYRR